MRNRTKILAWQKADDLTVAICAATRLFPKDELNGITSQLRRTASSSAANIVEGASRQLFRDHLHFLYIARGSLNETGYFVHLSGRLGYIAPDVQQRTHEQAQDASQALMGLNHGVEREAGPIKRTVAQISNLLILSWSTVFGLQSNLCGLRSVV